MPGKTIGQVYIEILADSKSLGPAARAAGSKAGKEYNEAFEQEFRRVALADVIDKKAEEMAVRYRKRMGDLRTLEQSDFGKLFSRIGAQFAAQSKQMSEDWAVDHDWLQGQLFAAFRRRIDDENRLQQQAEQERVDVARRAAETAYRIRTTIDQNLYQQRIADIRALERAQADASRRAQVELEREINATGRVTEATRAVRAAVADVERARRLNIEAATTEVRLIREQDTVLRNLFRRLSGDVQVFARTVGDVDVRTTRWSRSTGFLANAFDRVRFSLRRAGTGGLFDTLTNMLAILPGLVAQSFRFAQAIGNLTRAGFEKVGEGLNFVSGALTRYAASGGRFAAVAARVGAVLGTLGRVAGPIGAVVAPIVGLVAAIAGLAAVTKVVGVFASAITSVVGVISILAQTATYAASSLAAFIPLLAALPPVAGAILLGFQNIPGAISAFNDALNETDPEKKAEALEKYNEALGKLAPNAKAAVQALEPVIQSFKDLQSVIQDKLFEGIAEEIEALGPLFSALQDGLTTTADTVNQVIRDIAAEFRSDAYIRDFRANFEGLQPIIRDLGAAFGDFMAGLNSLITALLPSGQQLSGSIADMAANFKDFTQSAEGQNKIKEFMDKAWTAASTLKDILVTIGSTIGEVFGASDEVGQDFLEGVLNQANEFKAWIDERVADGRLQAWFEDVKNIAGEVWGAIEEVVKTIDRLDTPENRQALQGLLQGFQEFLQWIQNDFIPAMERVWEWMEPGVEAVGRVVTPLIEGFQSLVDFINGEGWGNLADALAAPFISMLEALALIPPQVPVFGAIGAAARAALGAAEGLSQGLTEKLQALQTQGQLTGLEFDVLTSDRTLSEWPDWLLGDLLNLYTQGQLTSGEFNALLADRDIPGWGEDFAGNLAVLFGQGEITLDMITQVLADRSLPSWVTQEYVTALSDIVGSGQLTKEQLNLLLQNENIPSWLATEIQAALDSATGKAGETAGGLATVRAYDGTTVNINVTDNGTAAGVQAAINQIKGRVVVIGVEYRLTGTSAGSGPGGLFTGSAAGRLVTSPMQTVVGEAGPEAIIPLTRPLSMVDPSVRDMAAMLRGEGRYEGHSVGGPTKIVHNTINVYPVEADPAAVAQQVMNRAVAMAR